MKRTKEPNRRYYLHQRCRKAEFGYSPRERTVEVPFSRQDNVPTAAVSLRNEYGYSLQMIID